MPISAAKERTLLNHYKLTSLYPTEWPREDDSEDSDGGENDPGSGTPNGSGRSTFASNAASLSRLHKHATNHSLEASDGRDRADRMVQKDESDPLGMIPSVAAELRKRGLPVEDNLKLRNRFMLSSTTFSPTMFLAQVHQDASTEDLLRGLDFLSRSIEQKSASLKVLVESNFEKFVRAKATIDNVYMEMRTQGQQNTDLPSITTPGRRPHSRHTSRNSQLHFRAGSGQIGSTNKTPVNSKKKTALVKESEFGVQGLRAPLQELSIRAEEIWGPALGGQEKEETLKSVLNALDQHREIFGLSGAIHESIRKNDHSAVLEEYRKAKRYVTEAKSIADIAQANMAQLGEADTHQILLTAKMWHDVSAQLEHFKRELWKQLRNSHGRKTAVIGDEPDKDVHMELIGTLLQLHVDENPIWVWLNSRCLYLKDKIARMFERARIEIEILRRRLGSDTNVNVKAMATYLRSVAPPVGASRRNLSTVEQDTPSILAFWEKVHFSLNALLSSKTGFLGEVLEFWETASSFIDNNAQKAFPNAVFAAGLEHLQLDPTEIHGLQTGAMELVETIRDDIMSLFSDPPVQDLSQLYSPIPPTPSSTGEVTPTTGRSYVPDPGTVPPPSPSRGDLWEKFAFWPPHSNSLSAGHYLSRMLILVGTAASEMSAMSIMRESKSEESLKTLVNAVRERCIQAMCTAWTTDAERCKYLEVWLRNPDRRDLTTMPTSFTAFEEKVLQNVQRIAYVSEASSAKGSADVILPPPAKLLQAARGSFVTSLYKALSGMVENAEKSKHDGFGEYDPDGMTLPQKGVARSSDETAELQVDARNKNVRMLMTLSNLAHLRSDVIPHLVSQFETSFSVKLTEENKTIRDVLSQIDSRLFQAYVRPTSEAVHALISAGIADPKWAPAPSSRPSDARPYVYEVLLTLVLVHSEVSTTASTLTAQVISYLLEQSSMALIAAFRTRSHYTLPALMQATLDVEFMAQTLNQFTTDRAGEVQSQIYLALDERTDSDARNRLQGELPEMRNILKRLREGTKGEFGCFKKERRGRERGATASQGNRN